MDSACYPCHLGIVFVLDEVSYASTSEHVTSRLECEYCVFSLAARWQGSEDQPWEENKSDVGGEG